MNKDSVVYRTDFYVKRNLKHLCKLFLLFIEFTDVEHFAWINAIA